MKFIIIIILLTIALPSCNDKGSEPDYEYFELSYNNGWTRGFSFKIYKNTVYYLSSDPTNIYPLKEGQVYVNKANSILLKDIDSAINLIEKQLVVNSDEHVCYDCPSLAIAFVKNGKNVELVEKSMLKLRLNFLEKSIVNTIEIVKCDKKDTVIYFRTAKIIEPPPIKN